MGRIWRGRLDLNNEDDFNDRLRDIGVAGVTEIVKEILIEAFSTRDQLPLITKRQGILYEKGVILYGPPGSGKTFIATKICELIIALEPKIVRGSELRSKNSIRNLFDEAIDEHKKHGVESKLHIIIIDEIDLMTSGTHDSSNNVIIDEFVAMIDVMASMNNIFIIGTTNRFDLIDKSLLRDKRFGLAFEIGYPNKKSRYEMIELIFRNTIDHRQMNADVDMDELAVLTEGFSRLSLSTLLAKGFVYAYERNGYTAFDIEYKMEDFAKAIEKMRNKMKTSWSKNEDVILQRQSSYGRSIMQFLEDEYGPEHTRKLPEDKPYRNIFNPHIYTKEYLEERLVSLGIGGLGEQLFDILLQAFSIRGSDPQELKRHNLELVRGMLLFGPTGCGKTVLAKEFWKFMPAKEPLLVSALDVMGVYNGECFRRARSFLRKAIADERNYGAESDMYVVVLDGIIDFVAKKGMMQRRDDDSEDLLQLLVSLMDGDNALNNLFVIATTDRADLVDENMLKYRRFQLHFKLDYPNERQRFQILKVVTKESRESGLLDEDVDLQQLARETEGACSAFLAHFLKYARDYAAKIGPYKKVEKIKMCHFEGVLQGKNRKYGYGRLL